MKTNFFSLTLIPLFFFLFTTPSNQEAIVRDVLTHTNIVRQNKGLKPLVMKDELNRIALEHSVNMASKKVPFSHDGFKERYQQSRTVIKTVISFAENVAYGPVTGKEAIDSWMTSPGHKASLLGDYTSTGIGVAVDSNGVHYYTQIFCKD